MSSDNESGRWLILLGLWLSYLSFGGIAASLAPMVALIQADLALSHSAMGSIMGAWQLVYIAAAVPSGMLLDRIGGRWAITIGVLLVAASAFGRAVADDYWSLLAAVMVFGLGGPIVSSGAPKIVTDVFQGAQRGLAMGIYVTGPTMGSIFALTLTNSVLLPLFDGSWRYVMALWGGVAISGAAAWLLISSLVGARTPGFVKPPDDGASESGSSGSVVFKIVSLPAVQLLLIMAVGAFLINHGLNNWLPELLRNGGMSAVEAGYWAALPMIVGIAGSLTIPRLATPNRRFVIIFSLCAAACLASASLTLYNDLVLPVALVLLGFVRSSMMTVLILTLVELPGVAGRHAGTASGLFFSAAEVGGVLGPLGMGLMYDLTHGFDAGLYLLAGIAALMALGSIRLAALAR